MATQMQTETRWENDGRRHVEKELPAEQAKQGRAGRRVLTVLISALVLAFIVWIPVELWGKREAQDMPSSTQIQTTAPKADPKPATDNTAAGDPQQK